MNIIIFVCILILIYIFLVNLLYHLKENFTSNDCQGGWLPWQKTGEKTCCQENEEGQDCKYEDLIENESRSYKVIKVAESNGSDCPFYNGKKKDISCNEPKPDDCLTIRSRYYSSSNPTEETKKNKCNMDNCIPPTNLTANCDSNLISIDEGTIDEKVGKRCPWICDPKKKLQGDGINSCSYDKDCAKCSPRKLFDRTNCGEKISCPNPLADDGCGFSNIIDYNISDNPIILPEDLEITDEKFFKQDYSKYIKPLKKGKTYNKYNLQKPSPPPLYKSLYDYIPFNSMHSFFS